MGNNQDWVTPAVVVGGLFLILKFTKAGEAVGNIGEGVGLAVGGTGAAIGEIAGDVAQTTSNIADFLNPLGTFGRESSELMRETFITQIEKTEAVRDEKIAIAEERKGGILSRTDIRQEQRTIRTDIRQEDRTQDLIKRIDAQNKIQTIKTALNPINIITAISTQNKIKKEQSAPAVITPTQTIKKTAAPVIQTIQTIAKAQPIRTTIKGVFKKIFNR